MLVQSDPTIFNNKFESLTLTLERSQHQKFLHHQIWHHVLRSSYKTIIHNNTADLLNSFLSPSPPTCASCSPPD